MESFANIEMRDLREKLFTYCEKNKVFDFTKTVHCLSGAKLHVRYVCTIMNAGRHCLFINQLLGNERQRSLTDQEVFERISPGSLLLTLYKAVDNRRKGIEKRRKARLQQNLR